VVVNPVDEIVAVGGVVVIHLFSYLWSRRLDQLPQVTKQMYNNSTPYNHYLVDWINYHR
jgi:hypothetical protein